MTDISQFPVYNGMGLSPNHMSQPWVNSALPPAPVKVVPLAEADDKDSRWDEPDYPWETVTIAPANP